MFEDLNSIKALSWDLFGLFAFVRGLYLFLTKRCKRELHREDYCYTSDPLEELHFVTFPPRRLRKLVQSVESQRSGENLCLS
jgi:hypothetical protein